MRNRWSAPWIVVFCIVVLGADDAAAQATQSASSSRGVDTLIMWSLQGVTALFSAVSAGYALYWTYRLRKAGDELFPRVNFTVDARFLGEQDGKVLAELSARIENKGTVPLKIKDFTFTLRGLAAGAAVNARDAADRPETDFPLKLANGCFAPVDWEYSFIYPGVTTEYNFVAAIPRDVAFMRLQSRFVYHDRPAEDHFAARAMAVTLPTRA